MFVKKFNEKLKKITIEKFPYTNVIGLSRSILALGTLLTLLFNPLSNIVHEHIDNGLINPFLSEISTAKKYNFFLLLGFDNIIIMKWLAIIILGVTISGFYIKITSLLHWYIAISFLYFSSIIDGGDQIASILSLLLIPLLLTDKRKNHWSKTNPYQSPLNLFGLFSIWAIRLQVAVIYFHASVGKIPENEWSNGTAIYYWFNHSVFGMPIWFSSFVNQILSNSIMVSFATYGVIILEVMLFLGLTASIKYRKRLLILGLIFHLNIIIFHGIFSFFFSISAGLILFLYPTYQHLNLKLWFQKK
tara:strand:- start:85 stop:993 length:909 start_codon:yes stop_codon:yes gene_type:complete